MENVETKRTKLNPLMGSGVNGGITLMHNDLSCDRLIKLEQEELHLSEISRSKYFNKTRKVAFDKSSRNLKIMYDRKRLNSQLLSSGSLKLKNLNSDLPADV
mmetsp:Transcript_23440/g.36112  ORF Transcript_23440/g.36112 Transcript_23440/m.36112 type:complete len:102 (+) Transcript_23440:623-928(+)